MCDCRMHSVAKRTLKSQFSGVSIDRGKGLHAIPSRPDRLSEAASAIAKAVNPDTGENMRLRLFQAGVLKPGVGHESDRSVVFHSESDAALLPDSPSFPSLQEYMKFSCNVRWIEVKTLLTEIAVDGHGA